MRKTGGNNRASISHYLLKGHKNRDEINFKARHIDSLLESLYSALRVLTEKNRIEDIFEGVCHSLNFVYGYYGAWIILFEKDGLSIRDYFVSGEKRFTENFQELISLINSGYITRCIELARKKRGVICINSPEDECGECPKIKKCVGHSVILSSFSGYNDIYGIIGICIERNLLLTGVERENIAEISKILSLKCKKIEYEQLVINIEEKLNKNEQKYRLLFNAANDAILVNIFDKNGPGKFVEINDKAASLFGYNKIKLLSRNFWDILSPDDKTIAEAIRKKLMDNKTISFETRIVSGDGKVIPVEVNSHLFRFDGRTLLYSVVRDITERKIIEELQKSYIEGLKFLRDNAVGLLGKSSGELFDYIADNLAEIIADSYVAVLSYNDSSKRLRLESLSGDMSSLKKLSSIIGSNPLGLEFEIPKSIEKNVKDGVMVKVDAGIYSLTSGFIDKDTARQIEKILGIKNIYIKGLMVENQIVGLIVILMKSEEQMAGNEIIDGFLSQATMAIYRDKIEKMRYVERKKANLYLDILSHDISNQNQIILGIADMIINFKSCDDSLREYIIGIYTASLAIASLIKNLRLLTKIEKEGIEATNLTLYRLIDRAIYDVKKKFPYMNIDVSYNIPKNLVIKGDNVLVSVFENILSNAVKFDRHKEKKIEISLSQEEQGEYIRIEFSDHGPGISDVHKKKIFQRIDFSRGLKATGLGLSLSKEVVRRCGGRIWVEDRVPGHPEKGARFILMLKRVAV